MITLSAYRKDWLISDITAGLVWTTVLVPVGVAHATASGLPGICGLYATIAPLLAYAVFGPSRILVLGPDSSLVAVILAVVLPLARQDSAIAICGMIAIVAGTLCLLAGIVQLGFVTELLSKPIRYGYMNGIALVVVISQLWIGLLVGAIACARPLLAADTDTIDSGPTTAVTLPSNRERRTSLMIPRPLRPAPRETTWSSPTATR